MNNNKSSAIKGFFKNLKQITRLYTNHKLRILIALIFALIATGFSMWAPKLLAQTTDELFNGLLALISGIGNIDFTKVLSLLVFVTGVYIFASGFQIIYGLICTNVSRKVCYELRNTLAEKITALPISYFEEDSKGNVLSRVINDVDMLGEKIAEILISIVTTTTMLLGSVIMMFTINIVLSLIVVVLIPLGMLIVLVIIKYSQSHFVGQQNKLGQVNGFIEEHIKGHTLIQAFNKQKETINSFDKINDELYKESLFAKIISGTSSPLINFIGKISYVIVVVLGAYFTIIGTMSVGNILAFVQYVNNFTNPLATLMNLFNSVQQMAAAAERIYKFLELPNDKDATAILQSSKTDSNNPVISFKNVSFGYSKNKTIINNFSLDIKKGQTVAIVGPTGAGKTTLVKLLMRFYDVDNGKIMLFGKNIKNYSKKSIRNHMAMVLQDIWLFSGTIKDNIQYGNLEANEDEVKTAGQLACADSFISKLNNDYNFKIDEGARNLSQGQNQLISIARAIIAEREIMILDEATSSVDTATEKQLYKAFDKLIEKKTSIVIAHRLSTIKNADVILVLNNGDIIEQGSHKELLAQKGFYYDLYQSSDNESDWLSHS